MASPSRRAQSAALPSNVQRELMFGTSLRSIDRTPKDDPLQPLRAMADRVGKEVEKFAERVDYWHTHGTGGAKAKYHMTMHMVGKFKDVADSTVQELKKQSDAENKGELQKSVARRIKDMAEGERPDGTGAGRSGRSPALFSEPSSIPNSSRVQELRHWQTEAATWDLLRIIIEHYHPEPGTDIAAEKRSRLSKVGGATRYSPNTEIWNRFLLEDDEAKEKELILKWLQESAKVTESDIESITHQLEQESHKDTATWTSGWLDTKQKIKFAKLRQGLDRPLDPQFGLHSDDKQLALITQLDPDAPNRQRKSLDPSDEYYERALWMVCYEMLRRGAPWEDTSEWCKAKGEAWCAVSIGASSEPNLDGAPNLSGSSVGFLFRRMCFFAGQGAHTQYQAAVYGLLSGDKKTVEAVCRSWDNHLYAHYNALLLARFDNYLLHNYTNKVPPTLAKKFLFHDASAELGSWRTSSKTVIDLLKEQKSTAALSLLPMKLIQGSLISRTIEDLVKSVGEAIVLMLQRDDRPTNVIIDPESDAEDTKPFVRDAKRTVASENYHQTLAADPHALRVLVHIFIVLRKGLGLFDMQLIYNWATMDNVIAEYIEFLRITKRYQLIPIYAAQLEGARAVHCLARVLPDIKNPEEQKNIIRLLEQYQLDPVEIVIQNHTLTSRREFGQDTDGYLSRYQILEPTLDQDEIWPGQRVKKLFDGLDLQTRDETLIDALRWLPHLEEDFKETFDTLQSAMIYLLVNGRVGAAEVVINEMSIETISALKTEHLCGYPFNFMDPDAEIQDPEEVTRAAREHLSNSGRESLRPSDIPNAADHTQYILELRNAGKMYYELQQLVRLIGLFREWRDEEDNLIKLRNAGQKKVSLKKGKEILEAIHTTLEPLLGDFLGDFEPGTPADNDAWTIRKAYIPDLVIAYISVCQTMAFFSSREIATKAMDIATVIADEERPWLQQVFLRTGRMKELVGCVARISRVMLKLGKADAKKAPKSGRKGESLRIWEVGVRN